MKMLIIKNKKWKEDRKAQIGFWKEGKQFGFGKFMNKKKAYFGIWAMGSRLRRFEVWGY